MRLICSHIEICGPGPIPGLSACRLSCRRRWLAGGKASGKTSVIVFGNQQTRPPGEQSIPVLQRHGACYAQCGQARTIPAPAVSPVRGHPDILYRSIAFSPERQRSFGTAVGPPPASESFGLSARPCLRADAAVSAVAPAARRSAPAPAGPLACSIVSWRRRPCPEHAEDCPHGACSSI